MFVNDDRGSRIVARALAMGADLAGMASAGALRASPSYAAADAVGGGEMGEPAAVGWPREAKSALVIALSHPGGSPELDWWDSDGSPGDRRLAGINTRLSRWIERELGIAAHPMPYSVSGGGVYLKDAAVLAGLGCLGRNNLLVTPGLGPRVRLRAMLLEEALPSTGPLDFDPCARCEAPCRRACPQNAFAAPHPAFAEAYREVLPGRDGRFSRAACMVQMDRDVADSQAKAGRLRTRLADRYDQRGRIKYCRACELACPVGG
jgi:epoxyqueuosine reductase